MMLLAFLLSQLYGDPIVELLQRDPQRQVEKLAEVGKGTKGCTRCRNQVELSVVTDSASKASTTPLSQITGSNGAAIDVSIVDQAQLKAMYDRAKGQMGLQRFWRNASFCWQRAHVMSAGFKNDMGIETAKLIVWPKRQMGVLEGFLTPQFFDGRRPLWSSHVAPVVLVKTNGVYEQWVIDPSTFDRPVKREEWESFLQNRARTDIANRFSYLKEDTLRRDITSYELKPGEERAWRDPKRVYNVMVLEEGQHL